MPDDPRSLIADDGESPAIPVHFVAKADCESVLSGLADNERTYAAAVGFTGASGQVVCIPGGDGTIGKVLFGTGSKSIEDNPVLAGKLAQKLPPGRYQFEGGAGKNELSALSFLLGGYRFGQFKTFKTERPKFRPGNSVDMNKVLNIADAVYTARDLINRPANDLGPDELKAALSDAAGEFDATISVTSGKDLAENFPMVHAVGQASTRAPLLADMVWGEESAPKVTLIGKGVAFDTGGLNIKPGNSMALMKKDMGGAASVIGLARMIMAGGLNVRLRVIVPAVENAISGNAFRPGDVLKSRKGLSVEIGNTDAEGRLILADALAMADEEKPEILISMATLTGAARVALGPDLPPFYCDDEDFAGAIASASAEVADPLWRMPLWKPYKSMLSSKIADINHISGGGFAGSITAALFLDRFVENAARFAHFDIYGWTPKAGPLSPEGGEAQGIRALYAVLSERYGGG